MANESELKSILCDWWLSDPFRWKDLAKIGFFLSNEITTRLNLLHVLSAANHNAKLNDRIIANFLYF